MSPLVLSNPTIVASECSNIAKAQGKDLKTDYMKMIEVHKKEI